MKLLCLGDSLTYGYPYDEKLSWTNALKKELNIVVINSGVNGDTTGDMLRRLRQEIEHYELTHVILMGGTNDVYLGVSLKEVKENYCNLISLAKEHSIIPVMALMPPVLDDSEMELRPFRDVILTIAQQENLYVIDFNNCFYKKSGEVDMDLFCDDCHPNVTGYQAMSKVAIDSMIKLIENSEN